MVNFVHLQEDVESVLEQQTATTTKTTAQQTETETKMTDNSTQRQQQQPETTIIIDIPNVASTLAAKSTATAAAAATTASTLSLNSTISTAYDTDSGRSSSNSNISSTCCTPHDEHIYMEKVIMPQDTLSLNCKIERRNSWPIFIFVISLVEFTIFYYDLTLSALPHKPDALVHIPTDSVFIYRPDRRLQVWRFFSYMFLHANWFHLAFNLVIQLFYGIPLEVMHGSTRICIIYFAGVFAGSLGTSVVESEVYLVGASGGVYALLAAHFANLMLNYAQMKYADAQLFSVGIFVFCDVGYAVYTQYINVIKNSKLPSVSYVAHLTGGMAGLTIGLLVLKNFEHRTHENLIWWLALGVYSAFTVFAIVFNLINTETAQLMEEQGEILTQQLLHDLGMS